MCQIVQKQEEKKYKVTLDIPTNITPEQFKAMNWRYRYYKLLKLDDGEYIRIPRIESCKDLHLQLELKAGHYCCYSGIHPHTVCVKFKVHDRGILEYLDPDYNFI